MRWAHADHLRAFDQPNQQRAENDVPVYNGRDKVKAEHRLITEALGIPHLLAVTGYLLGRPGQRAVRGELPGFHGWHLPDCGRRPKDGRRHLLRCRCRCRFIESCEGWDGGNYDENPKQCAANALSRSVPYFYTREWWDQYIDTPEAYTNWRNNWGDYYLDIQDARDLYYRMMASGSGWVGDTPGFNGDVNAVLRSIKAKTLFICSPQDQFLSAAPDRRAGQGDSECARAVRSIRPPDI